MLEIKVMGYSEAFRYVYDHSGYAKNKDFAIISLQEYPEEEMGVRFQAGGHCKGALNLHVSDIDRKKDEVGHLHLMTDEDANQIKNFVEDMIQKSEISLLIIHCHAGISRSAAVAAALYTIYEGNSDRIFESCYYSPNMYVYKKVLKAYGHKNGGSTCKSY